MEEKNIVTVIANFGGPRNLKEVSPFLVELLTDQDVVRTNLPSLIHNFLFTRIAKRRAKKIAKDYEEIGGCSPIYADTESVAKLLREKIEGPLLTFHRYLPETHQAFVKMLSSVPCDEIRVFPMFPQFTYATTGSIARWFEKMLPKKVLSKIRWIKSYPTNKEFIRAHQKNIEEFLKKNNLKECESVFLFSAHGIPKKFVKSGDLYLDECQATYNDVMKGFPNAVGHLCFQSKFGPGEWLRPYTIDSCKEITKISQERKDIIFIPISFTSDHIETLFEIETEYMPEVRENGLNAYRVPALTLNQDWILAIEQILRDGMLCNNQMLVRKT